MKSIEQLQLEIKDVAVLVREKNVKILLVNIGEMITKRHGWVKRREEEISELTDLDNKMRKAYLADRGDILEEVETEIAGFDEKNKGRSRPNYGRI